MSTAALQHVHYLSAAHLWRKRRESCWQKCENEMLSFQAPSSLKGYVFVRDKKSVSADVYPAHHYAKKECCCLRENMHSENKQRR